VVRRGVKAALEAKASALVIDMNTPGGEGEAMKEVMATIAKFQPADRTYTYVNQVPLSQPRLAKSGWPQGQLSVRHLPLPWVKKGLKNYPQNSFLDMPP
jgi:hypothetical protein